MYNRIVVVDDDLDMHFIYEKVFQRLGIADRMVFFENGEDALDYLTSHSSEVQLILSDLNMPVMDGLELRRAINESDVMDCRCIPFIFLSTSARETEVKMAYELMVQGFFQKGLTLGEIESTIRVVLNYWGKCRLPELAVMC